MRKAREDYEQDHPPPKDDLLDFFNVNKPFEPILLGQVSEAHAALTRSCTELFYGISGLISGKSELY